MLEYADPMLSFRRGVSGVLCAVGLLLSGACAAQIATADDCAGAISGCAPTRACSAAAARSRSRTHRRFQNSISRRVSASCRKVTSMRLLPRSTARSTSCSNRPAAPVRTRGLSAHFDRLVERISGLRSHGSGAGRRLRGKGVRTGIDRRPACDCDLRAPTPTPETERTVADDLQAVVHDIEIPLNARVLAYVELFTGRLKGYLEDGLSRGARYLPMIQEVFRAEGLPLDLAYVPLIESAFKPNALSRAKAKGMWQFMRGTALENGLQPRLVHRRARRSGESHARSSQVSEDALLDVRRLAPGACVVQRRAGACAARDEALRTRTTSGSCRQPHAISRARRVTTFRSFSRPSSSREALPSTEWT